jgi:hypothetical protein
MDISEALKFHGYGYGYNAISMDISMDPVTCLRNNNIPLIYISKLSHWSKKICLCKMSGCPV